MQETEPLGRDIRGQRAHPGRVTSWLIQARDQSGTHRVFAGEHDRDRRGCRFGGHCRSQGSRRDDNPHLAPDQIGRQRWQSIVLALGRSVLDRDVLTLRIAGFLQALAECGHQVHGALDR